MKLICTMTLCIVSVFLVQGCRKSGEPFSGPPNSMKRYPYERLHLTYEYSGDVRGVEELFVTDYGREEARYSKFEVLTERGIHPEDNANIMRFADSYSVDFSQKKIIHRRIRFLDSLFHLNTDETPSSQEYLEAEMKKNFFASSGTETIAGKPAQKWQQVGGGMTLWVWNNVLLRKHSTSPDGSLDMIVKNIDSLWMADSMKFAIPVGFPIIEVTQTSNAPGTN